MQNYIDENRNFTLTGQNKDRQIRQQSRLTLTWMLILTMIICLLTGCGGAAATDSAYNGGSRYDQKVESEYEYSVEMDGALNDMMEAPSAGSNGSGATGGNLQAVSSRKLITTVNMETETEHYDDLMTWLSARIAEHGGYVEFSESYGNQKSRRSATLTLRIPSASLDVFLTGLSEESNVTYQSRSVKDITLNYVDVQSHKEALLVEQERLMELLQKAENLNDLLTIEERLTHVRYELESYESQLRTYDNQIDYSTVHLTIREVKVLTAPEPESFWERVTAGFKNNLEDVTDDLTEFAIGFLSSIPTLLVWGVILVVAFLILRKINRIRRDRTPKKEKSKKRWGKKESQKEIIAGEYIAGDTYSQPEKKDGE